MSSFPLSPQYVRNNIKVESKVRMGYPSPRYSLLQHIPRRTSPPRGVEHNCFSSLIARPTTLPSLLMNVQLLVKMYRDKKGGKDGIYKVSLLRPPHVATWEFYKLKHPPPSPQEFLMCAQKPTVWSELLFNAKTDRLDFVRSLYCCVPGLAQQPWHHSVPSTDASSLLMMLVGNMMLHLPERLKKGTPQYQLPCLCYESTY